MAENTVEIDVRARSALTGRADALAQLSGALAQARAGRPQLVLVEGAAGIGKTALLRSFVAEHPDATLIWASGDASERTVTFSVADQIVRQAGKRDLPALLTMPASQYTEVGRILLDLLDDRRPVLLMIDDAQWADVGSLKAVLFAFRRLVADTVLTVVTARADELHRLPDGLVRSASRLCLEPFSLDDARALAHRRELALPARTLRRMHELSAGVPLHLCALFDEWEAHGELDMVVAPPSYAALVAGRLLRCSEPTARLVEAASVLGRRASTADVLALAEVDEPSAALTEAVSQDLLRVSSESVEFVHPMTRAAVHDALGPRRLAELHTAAAELAADPETALLHRAQAATGPVGELADDLEAAAWAAAADGSWLRSADLLTEAAQLTPTADERDRRVWESVRALWHGGDLVGARAMIPTIRALHPSAHREFVLGGIAHSLLDIDGAERHLHAAWSMYPADDPQLGTRIAGELASCAYFRVDPDEFAGWARRAMELTAIGDRANASAVTKLAIAEALAGRLDVGVELLDAALAAAPEDAVDLAQAQTARGRLRFIADDLAGGRADLTTVTAGVGASRAGGLAFARLSLLEYYAGHWDLALTYADRGLAACVDRTDYAQMTCLRAPAVLVLAARGAWSEAEHHLQAMDLERGDATLPAMYAGFATVHFAHARSDAEGVVAAGASLLALPTDGARIDPGFWPWEHMYADALIDLNRLEEAERFLLGYRDGGRRSLIGRFERSRARLAAAQGNDELALAAFVRSAEAFESIGMPYELALTELAHGQYLRRRRRRRAAVESLTRARPRLDSVGAHPTLDACERELRASGLAPKRPDGGGTDRLTPQEATVARLVVDGMTNREIAGELIVSTKTIEVHLTSVYAKLGVGSRSELRARARRGELTALTA